MRLMRQHVCQAINNDGSQCCNSRERRTRYCASGCNSHSIWLSIGHWENQTNGPAIALIENSKLSKRQAQRELQDELSQSIAFVRNHLGKHIPPPSSSSSFDSSSSSSDSSIRSDQSNNTSPINTILPLKISSRMSNGSYRNNNQSNEELIASLLYTKVRRSAAA
jgi:hypothetical protein